MANSSFTLVSRAREAGQAVSLEARQKSFEAANEIRNAWLIRLSGQRSGRQYRVPGTSRYYTASAPGESPAVRLGDARRTIEVAGRAIREVSTPDGDGYEVGTTSKVLMWLEYGTGRRGAATGKGMPADYSHGGSIGMAARPSLAPALEDARPELDRIFGTDWKLE